MVRKSIRKGKKSIKIELIRTIRSLLLSLKPTVITLVFIMLSSYLQQKLDPSKLDNCTSQTGDRIVLGALISSFKDRMVGAGSRTLYISNHAMERMAQRKVTGQNLGQVLEMGKLFAYSHGDRIKIGYYYNASKIFMAVDQEHKKIITVIKNVPVEYVSRLIVRR